MATKKPTLREELRALQARHDEATELYRVYTWWLEMNPGQRAPSDRWLTVVSKRLGTPYVMRTGPFGQPTECAMLGTPKGDEIENTLRRRAWDTNSAYAEASAPEYEAFQAALAGAYAELRAR